MHHILIIIKRHLKKVPWLYILLFRGYVFLRKIKANLRLAKIRRNLGIIARSNPHLYIYACHINTILKGNASTGLRNLGNQISTDFHNWRVLYKNRAALEELKQLYLDAILCCIQHRVSRWWEFLPNAKFDSLQTLNNFLLECVLRRAGDYNEYLRIKDALRQLFPFSLTHEDCYYALAKYYAKTMEEIEGGHLTQGLNPDPDKRPFFIGFSVWGERYLHLLLNYCLPSLMAKGNLDALCKERQPILFIHTNPESKHSIEQADIIHRIQSLGVIVHYRMLDESLIALFPNNPNFRYWHLGMMQSLDLYIAKAMGADFHLLLPDQIYADNHFTGILQAASRGHKAITRLGLSTRMEGICPAVESYRQQSGEIVIPAGDLAALGVTHVHSASWPWIATGKNLATELPNAYMIVWEGKDTLHMLSPHQTILYLDREILSSMPKRFYLTLDSELDKIIPPHVPVYCPKQEDGLFLVEVTSEKQRPTELRRNPIQEFCRTFWYGAQSSMTYWRFFDHGIIDSLNRKMLPDREYMEDADIDRTKHMLKRYLLDHYPAISVAQIYVIAEILRKVKASPKAKHTKELIEEIIISLQLPQEAFLNLSGNRNTGICVRLSQQRKKYNAALEKLYHEAILCCIRHRVHRWWSFLPNKKFRSIPILQAFLRECILRRAGDYTEFLRIRRELELLSVATTKNEVFLDKMAEYYAKTMEEIDSGLLTQDLNLNSTKRPFLIGFSVWGERYLNMLLNYCLPSMLAAGNLAALCEERQPILFIHTNPESKRILEQADVIHRIRSLGVIVTYKMINEELVSHFSDDSSNIYWHLGLVQSIDLFFAKKLGADYHLLMPDSIYSDHHFSGLLRAVQRGHKVIIRLMLSTRIEGICPAIDHYRHDGVITIPAADLTALSIAHVHSASRSWIITHNDLTTELPNVHVIILEGKDTLHMLSPHQTLLYLDHEVLQGMPARFYLSLDSELDKIIPDDYPIYCPKPDDEICLIESTSEKQRPMELSRYSIKEFCKFFWHNTQESMAYWKVFDQSNIDALNRKLLPDRRYMNDAEIINAKQTIKNALLQAYPAPSDEQKKLALEILKAIRSHPNARNILTLIDADIAEIRNV